jgi:hypothetical protein
MPKLFTLEVEDVPGRLGDLAAGLADRGINVEAVAGFSHAGRAVLGLTTNDDTRTRIVLEGKGIKFQEEELLTLRLPNKPGELARVARKLGENRVNLRALVTLTTGQKETEIGLAVDNPSKVRALLK